MGLTGDEEIGKKFLYIIRLEIVDTYPGTTWEDTCLAELWPDYGPTDELRLGPENQRLSNSHFEVLTSTLQNENASNR
ncbi:MAG TPA: hypothetical protein ENN41_05675 [Sediminispirochaeta sp.]|nr:hypothetical protein [Sediminispirochaeta sp.]